MLLYQTEIRIHHYCYHSHHIINTNNNTNNGYNKSNLHVATYKMISNKNNCNNDNNNTIDIDNEATAITIILPKRRDSVIAQNKENANGGSCNSSNNNNDENNNKNNNKGNKGAVEIIAGERARPRQPHSEK